LKIPNVVVVVTTLGPNGPLFTWDSIFNYKKPKFWVTLIYSKIEILILTKIFGGATFWAFFTHLSGHL
jgi:hypothetical protein